jgi:C6 transcription factor Pro1
MHYLDNVFPLQYPMYKANVLHGGRGWLLSPMFRIKPLYHATLAISSYHYRKIVNLHHPCQVTVLVEQENHLQICLAEFQQMLIEANTSLENLVCPSHGLGIMTLIVQLIFLEVCISASYVSTLLLLFLY